MKKKTWLCLCLAAAAGLFLMSPSANAAVDTVGVHVGSVHFPQNNFNNVNPGLYVAGSINNVPVLPDGRYVVGAYYNSERKGSLYAGFIYPVTEYVDVVLGAITGYSAAPILPLVAPSLHFPIMGAWSGRVLYVPKIEKSGAHVIHLSLERKF